MYVYVLLTIFFNQKLTIKGLIYMLQKF